MKIYKARFGRYAVIAHFLVTVASVRAQGTVIGPATLNGSFEDGVVTPWFGAFTVAQDSNFASHGSWYGVVEDSLIFAPLAIQSLNPAPTAGLAFSLTFDARVGILGYSSVSAAMNGRNQNGPISAFITPIAAPPLSSSVWQSYEFLLALPAPWDNAGVSFSIRFSRDSTDGVLRSAYLDNVVLTQVPEPSALALLGLGGFFVVAQASCRRRSKR